jgi:hypothetical protein
MTTHARLSDRMAQPPVPAANGMTGRENSSKPFHTSPALGGVTQAARHGHPAAAHP